MVTILSVGLSSETLIEHERRTSPLMCTEQAPHCAMPQPYLVPVRPTCSRIAHSRGVLGLTLTSMELPLIVKRTIAFPPRITVLEISAILPRKASGLASGGATSGRPRETASPYR